MTIKLVTFDLDDTLWDAGPILRTAEQKQFTWLQKQLPDFHSRIDRDDMFRIRSNMLKDNPELVHDLSQLRTGILAQALREYGCDEQASLKLAGLAFEVFLEARHDVVFYEHALELLKELSQTYILGALSNGNASIERLKLDKYFSFSYSSATVGARKPAPDMFLAAMHDANVEPGEMVHIGDHPIDDVQGAAMLGIHCIWLNLVGREQPGPDLAYREIRHLGEVTGLLNSF